MKYGHLSSRKGMTWDRTYTHRSLFSIRPLWPFTQNCSFTSTSFSQTRFLHMQFYTYRKITMFGAIFEVNSSIGKLQNLLGHFDEKGTVDFIKYHFLSNNIL